MNRCFMALHALGDSCMGFNITREMISAVRQVVDQRGEDGKDAVPRIDQSSISIDSPGALKAITPLDTV